VPESAEASGLGTCFAKTVIAALCYPPCAPEQDAYDAEKLFPDPAVTH